ncbi:MAG: NAD(P)/FAD-dependent oxidoreductase [Actinophytocola sp.]|uniref:NAD(P)/FAD-dependent oxidoreductase n=1 Tax=Actinophytocola sp. TaxID=1872138 RepID=UPI003D6A4EAC
MDESADVVVIGAGVIGSAVAFELARRGLRVVVVDKGSGAGQGSTSASSAIMRFHYSTLDGVVAAWESMHCWARWADHLGAAHGDQLAVLRRTGAVMLDAPISNRDRSVELFEQVGVPYEDWDAAELRRRVPGLDPGRFWPPKRLDDPAFWSEPDGELAALYTVDGGFVDDPLLATRNLADAAVRHGARYLFRQVVTEIRRAGDRVAGVTLSGGRMDTPVVVNCAGPWSGRVNTLAGVGGEFTITVRPLRQEVHHLAAPPGYHDRDRLGPVIADPDLGIYLRPESGDAVLVGGTEPDCDPLDWVDDPDTANLNRTASLYETQVTRAARRFPELRIPSQPKGIAGIYDVASDWTPIYDRTDLDGYYVAVGTSGNQFKNAPLAGRMMATLITAVENGHDHDADPVSYACQHTGHAIGLGTFSRKREINPYSTGTVMG